MFPRADPPAHPARAWADALRRALDVLVAFATLRDADASSDGGPTAREPARSMSLPTAPELAPSRAADRLRRRAEEPARHVRSSGAVGAKTRRGVAGPEHAVHPHRRALTAPVRQRRPGAVRPQPQPCLTPLAARRARRPGVSTGRPR
jgi:hypothetical protein